MHYFRIKNFSEDNNKKKKGLLRRALDTISSIEEKNSYNYKSRKWGKAIKDWNNTGIVKAVDDKLEEDLL